MRHFWVDRIVELEPGVRAAGVKAVALAEDEFDAHFPGNPVLPGVYLLEGIAQTAGLLIHQTVQEREVAVLTTIERARFQAFARPGDLVRFEVELESLESGIARARGTATVAGNPVASARLAFKLVSPDRLIPDPYRPFWRQMIDTWMGRYLEIQDG